MTKIKHPIKIKDFLSFCPLEAKFNNEKTTVIITVMAKIAIASETKGETIVNDKGDIIKDQLLGIKGIEIDEIDIGSLIYSGVYKPEYPEPWATQQRELGTELEESLSNVTRMGHNGTWTLKFASPFYMWLLENLY